MFRVLIVFLIFCGTAWAEENWQLKYENLAAQHAALLDESVQLKSLITRLSLKVTKQESIERRNKAAVLRKELKQIAETKKEKAKTSVPPSMIPNGGGK
ncbi:hypothetical protein DSCW_17980 [Desulfosarcina widdelii]|uniref:Uncharacterized protein n=1 Tax=Desulfosarcina widdelii TaxID=947919 RepID=A0A5K7Z475_9BACT|nr:hypothetical protein [Desulfosarcina widdelii]BBO74381.1 hypothetical protein DSCW_17980 [Desulfosarcina widdelii]